MCWCQPGKEGNGYRIQDFASNKNGMRRDCTTLHIFPREEWQDSDDESRKITRAVALYTWGTNLTCSKDNEGSKLSEI